MTIGSDVGPNVVKIGLGGTFRPSGEIRTNASDIDAIFAHVKQSAAERLTLHFHGGLNSAQQGLATARMMQSTYKDVSYPITFVWETGFIETLRQNLRTVSYGDLFESALRHVIGATARRLGLDSGLRGAGAVLVSEQVEAELAREEPFAGFEGTASVGDAVPRGGSEAATVPDQMLLEELEVELEAEVAADSRLEGVLAGTDPDVRLLDPARARPEAAVVGERGIASVYVAKSLALISYRVLRRFWVGRNHGFYPTVIEEILREFFVADFLKWVWDGMKIKASQMWRPNVGVSGLNQFVGSYFLDRLAEFQSDRPDLIVDVVGHSAGAIALCHLLAATPQRPTVKIRRVVFLAPACTVGQFQREVVTQPGRFREFRMFALRDARERTDRLVPYVYPWSLLYFVSGALEPSADEPVLGLERSVSGLPAHESAEMSQALAFLGAKGAGRIVWTGEPGGEGFRSEARTHGAFDDDPATLQSLRWLAAH